MPTSALGTRWGWATDAENYRAQAQRKIHHSDPETEKTENCCATGFRIR
jgi:hypothetical protein